MPRALIGAMARRHWAARLLVLRECGVILREGSRRFHRAKLMQVMALVVNQVGGFLPPRYVPVQLSAAFRPVRMLCAGASANTRA